MKKFILILSIFVSCTIPQNEEGPISNTGPIITPGNGNTITPINLIGQTWRINHYRVGELGQMIPTNDILQFTSNTSYKFNGVNSTYNLTLTGSGYNLTLNETPWGNLSGSILSNNILSGNIPGIPFKNIATGSSNQTNYYLWIVKL
jgi:hypothetical protein